MANKAKRKNVMTSQRLVDTPAALVLLWIDMTVTSRQTRLPRCFDENFEVRRLKKSSDPLPSSEMAKTNILCFDFDYPDISGLRLLRATKQQYPSYPIIMLTEQHSEELAVWAFRERVWDYLVKPISEAQAKRTLNTLTSLPRSSSPRSSRQVELPRVPLPMDVRFQVRDTKQSALRPAINYALANFRTKLTAGLAANLCSMSPCRFSRAFKAAYGITFQEFMIRLRTREACRLLNNPNASITDIAYSVGFNDVSYFGRMFKRYCKLSPTSYRQNILSHGSAEDLDIESLRLHLPGH